MHPHRVVIVTGVSSGIGEAIARRLLTGQFRVVGVARRQGKLDSLVQSLASESFLAICGDITVEEDRKRVVATALERFGRIDALVNNAGWGLRGPLEQVEIESVRANYETNVFSLLALTQHVLQHLRKTQGRIVNIGSVAGRIARPLTSVYDSTKHALEALTEGLRAELKPWGIHVALVRPGFIETEFVDAANQASAHTLANLGPYAPYLATHHEKSARLRRVAGKPDDVARVVEHALLSTYPKNEYAAPFHAKVFLLLKWLLPAAIFRKFVAMR
ncbi:MAG: SDR family NAD(P)-dependent oxidoreductase [Opitutaceae bacterium]|nr:SDR family NAD(P)-dependent oxidoreductase [Opitutaceae bacterium]